MTGAIRRHALVMVVALVTASLTAGAPALAAKAVPLAKKAKFAKNAGKLDGLDSTAFARTGDLTWTNLSEIPAGFADGVDDDTTYSAGDGILLTGTELSVDTSSIQARVDGVCAAGSSIREINADGTVTCEVDDTSPTTFWSLTGNGGTVEGTNFVGTTDNVALSFRVNDSRAFRLEPNATSPNVIGGFSGNAVTATVAGATIGGGGEGGSVNLVTDDFGAIGGGVDNQAGNDSGTTVDRRWATVGGGSVNTASGEKSTVSGGTVNTASGLVATVGGGSNNMSTGSNTTVSGGTGNTAGSADYATVGGGNSNSATGIESFIGGGRENTATATTATVAGGFSNDATVIGSFIGGGAGNTANSNEATVGGGDGNTASGTESFVGGGLGNVASGTQSTIAGGDGNVATSTRSTIGGGFNNDATNTNATVAGGGNNTASGNSASIVGGTGNLASGQSATVGGGNDNISSGIFATVGGGNWNNAAADYATIAGGAPANFGNVLGTRNVVTDNYGTIGGGGDNQAGDGGATTDRLYASVAGGQNNTASGSYGVVSGGANNTASNTAAVVGGGSANTASALGATIGGGQNNTASGVGHATVGGGSSNIASAQHATVGGGTVNTAGDATSTIAGGSFNTAGPVASIGGGNNNSATGTYSSIPGGRQAAAPLFGQMAHASEGFAVAGDAQTSEYVLRNVTANATPTELFLDGVDDQLTLGAGRRLAFQAYVVGGTTAGESGGYLVTGLIERVGATTALVAAPTVAILGEDDAAWDVTVTADDGSDALSIEVTGDSADATRWVAMVQTAEVVF